MFIFHNFISEFSLHIEHGIQRSMVHQGFACNIYSDVVYMAFVVYTVMNYGNLSAATASTVHMSFMSTPLLQSTETLGD